MEKKQQFSIWYFLIAFVPVLAMHNYVTAPHARKPSDVKSIKPGPA